MTIFHTILNSALRLACSSRYLLLTRLFLLCGADVNVIDSKQHNTALMLACHDNAIGIAQLLLEHVRVSCSLCDMRQHISYRFPHLQTKSQ